MSASVSRNSPLAAAVAAGAGVQHEAQRCERTGCGGYAWWRLAVRVWPRNCETRTERNCIEFQMGLMCCDDCKKNLHISDVVGDQGWRQISEHIKASGYAKPSRASMELAFYPVAMAGSA